MLLGKTHYDRLPEHPTKKHVELVAYQFSETGNTGLKKDWVCMPCAVSATVRCALLEIIVLR